MVATDAWDAPSERDRIFLGSMLPAARIGAMRVEPVVEPLTEHEARDEFTRLRVTIT